MAASRYQPIYVLSDSSQVTRGRTARGSNVRAGKAVASAVRTTLGPRGMDKMLVDSSGDVVVTNDGATILGEMDIEHPAARMIVEVAETQEEEVGDGTTTAAVLAGELLVHAEELLDSDLHPTVVVEGYDRAMELALGVVDDQTLDVDLDDETLRRVAESSMTGKGTGGVTAGRLAELVVRGVRMAHEAERFDRDDVRVEARVGASSAATELVEGVIVDEEPVHDDMPRRVEDAAVATLDVTLEVRKADVDVEYEIATVDQLTAALEAEDGQLRSYATTLRDAGVDVVFSSKSIDDRVAAYLADQGILAFASLSSSDLRAVARATGARRLGTVDGIGADDLGRADAVRVERVGDDDLAFVEGGSAARAVTLFVRGGTEHVVDELGRAIADAIDVVVAALDEGGIVPGAGHVEIAIADALRARAASVEGRQQLAVEAFADAVEMLPRTLAENVGMDAIDALVDLRARFEAEGRAGVIAVGRTGEVGDPVEHGVFDPAAVKREAIRSATEAATMILRIDDVIAAE